jgi:hypothetical protein
MTFKSCLAQSEWSAVRLALSNLFPDCVGRLDDFQFAYEELRHLEPVINKTRLTIGRYVPKGMLSFYVVGLDDDCPKGFSLKFSPWQRWLGACVDPLLLNRYQLAEVCAICLNDMMWAGFSSKEVITFRKEYIQHEDCLEAIFEYGEMIEASEPDRIKRQQRSHEFFEALGLEDLDFDDFDNLSFCKNKSPAFRQALHEMKVSIYCLGETETDFDQYSEKVSELKQDLYRRWPDPSRNHALVH